MTAAVLVVILLVVLALVFVIAIVGMVVAMVRAWPERPADLDPYLNVHGEVPNLPWAARRGSL